MSDHHPHAESLTAAWKQAVQRVTHTAVDPKARRQPQTPDIFLFVTTSSNAEADASAEREAPLEAACLAVALEVTGLLPRVSERERKLVRDAARRAILAAQPAPAAPGMRDEHDAGIADDVGNDDGNDDDDDDDEADEADARRVLIELAREGVRALSGGARPGIARHPRANAGADAWHPPPSALVAMQRGGPDAIAAGSVAVHVLRCAACQAALEVASFADAGPIPLRAAAASAPAMLAPGEGRLLARRTNPDAEAYAFDDESETRLAIYVDTAQPLHYLAEGVTTDDMRPGYWAGRCPRATSHVEGTLHVGDTVEHWALDVTRS
jgi:hypothetical protein